MPEPNDIPLRALLITQYFPPETGAPQARLSELCARLVGRGIDVEVLTALPSYPVGRVFDGYRGKLVVRERHGGVSVVRTPIFPSRSARFSRRMLSYLSFAASSVLFGIFLVRRPDVIVVESPPLFLGLSAVLMKWLFRAPLVLNVSDLWPESAVHVGVIREDSLATRAARVLERFLYRRASLCTGQSEGILKGIRKGYPRAETLLIPNGCDTKVFKPGASRDFRESLRAEGSILVGYAGLLGLAQGVELILQVARRLEARRDVHFVLVGDGPEREKIVASLSRDAQQNVTFVGHVPREEMPRIVASFDIALIPLRHSIPGALPSKIYEAMAVEVPVVFAGAGDGADLLRRSGAGLVVDYADVDAVAAAVERLSEDPSLRRSLGEAGRRYVVEHHDRDVVAARLEAALKRLRPPASGKQEQERV